MNTVRTYEETICSGSDDKCLIEWEWMHNRFVKKEMQFALLSLIRVLNSRWLVNNYDRIDIIDIPKQRYGNLMTKEKGQIQAMIGRQD